MNGNRELGLLLNHPDAIALLGPWYGQQLLSILRVFSRGIPSMASPRRFRTLMAELRQRLALLYPRRSPFLRAWLAKWFDRAFWLGEKLAQRDIQEARDKAEGLGAVAIPMEEVSERDGQNAIDNVRGRYEAVLQSIAVQMQAAVLGMAYRLRGSILADPTLRDGITDGVMRSGRGQEVINDLRRILDGEKDAATVRRLFENGIPRDVLVGLDRLQLGVVISWGKRMGTPETVATQAGKRAILDTYNEGILLASQENAVLYVEIYHVNKGDLICPYCAGVEFCVFYAGNAEADPLGFPRLADLPSRPPFHQNCDHHLRPWANYSDTGNAYEEALAKSLSIPVEFFGPGAVERVNHGHTKEGAA